jgi:DNA-binding NtrC family response regulator
MVQDGTFREDLFYRVHVLPVSVPPLEGRRTDIPDLAAFFVRRLCVREGVPLKHLTAEAVRWLVAQPWPGNVRQLENLLHRAVILATGDRIDVADLDPTPAPAPGMDALFTPLAGDALPRLEALQAAYIHHVITRSGGNLTRAARILGIGRTTLYRHKGVNGQKM